MIRSLFTAISALRSHSTMMDVVASNTANVNTTSYKAGRLSFQESLSQTIRGGSAPTATRGGTNPAQIGMGMQITTILAQVQQGDIAPTGKNTDLAIQGEGYFIVTDGALRFYTRDGAFDVDREGTMIDPGTGMHLLGWVPNVDVNGDKIADFDANGELLIDSTKPLTDIVLPLTQSLPAKATTNVKLTGNLNVATPVDAPLPAVPVVIGRAQTTVSIHDAFGTVHNVTMTFIKTAVDNTWGVKFDPSGAGSAIGTVTPALTTVTFNEKGAPSETSKVITITVNYNTGVTQEIKVNIADIAQVAATSEVNMSREDGYAAGSLLNFDIMEDGRVRGIFSNGIAQTLGQLALARFPNPVGLIRAGANNFAIAENSGLPAVGRPDTGGRGKLAGSVLELSNVNLADQFTNMILAQRGFQANSRVITTSDEMLQDLISLKR